MSKLGRTILFLNNKQSPKIKIKLQAKQPYLYYVKHHEQCWKNNKKVLNKKRKES